MQSEMPFLPSSSQAAENSREDLLLWESIRKGNDLAFSSFYKKYVQSLFNYGMHIQPNRELVKDCIQELFTKIWEKKESLGPVEKVRFYLFRSFKNLIFNKIEAASKKSIVPEESLDRMIQDFPVENLLIDTELVEARMVRLQKAVSLLTNRQKEVIFLRFFQSLEIKEIAQIMNISIPGVHNLLSNTVKSLREKINWNEVIVLFFFLIS